MGDLAGMIRDERFQALDDGARAALLEQADPRFAALPMEGRGAILAGLRAGQAPTTEPAGPEWDLYRDATEPNMTPGRTEKSVLSNLGAGALSGMGSIDNTTANVLEAVGARETGAMMRERGANLQREAWKKGDDTMGGAIAQGFGGLAPGLLEAGAAASIGGPTLGFAGLGYLSKMDQGFFEAAKAAVIGGLTGKALTYLNRLPPIVRPAAFGALFGGVAGVETGGDVKATTTAALTGVALGLPGVLPERAPAAPIVEKQLEVRPATPAEAAAPAEPPPTTTIIDPKLASVSEVPISRLKLSRDVPNFKAEASPETGVVPGNELAGKYERLGTAPIVAWQRSNGDLEVITGRHRLDLARRSGEQTIPAQIVSEAGGFTKDKALRFDAESNIRDGQGSTKDYAHYFRSRLREGGGGVSQEEAARSGLLSRAKGRAGWQIGTAASDDLYSLFADGKVSDAQAAAIARTAPGNAELQRVGSRAALAGEPADFIGNLMQAVKSNAEAGPKPVEGDLFGGNDATIKAAEAQAKVATRLQEDIRQRISAVSGASKRPEVAREMGVDVRDPAAVKGAITALRSELVRWESWFLYPDLVAQTKGQATPTGQLGFESDLAQATSRAPGPGGPAMKLPPPQAVPDPAALARGMVKAPEPKLAAFEGGAGEPPRTPEGPNFAGNINLDRLNTSEGVKQALRDTAKHYDEFRPERRGVVSWDKTEELATQLGMTVDELQQRQKGSAMNAHEVLAARGLMLKTGEELTAARDAHRGEPTTETRARLAFALARHAGVQEQVAGATAEAGRALNIFRKLANVREEGARLKLAIKQAGGADHIDAIAEILDSMPTEATRNKVARKALQITNWDRFIEYWKASLLSGMQSSGANTISNELYQLLDLGNEVVAGAVGRVRGTVAPGEVSARVRSMAASHAEAVKVAAHAVGSIEGARDMLRFVHELFTTEKYGSPAKDPGRLELTHEAGAIGGKKGTVIRTTFRWLNIQDQVFKTMASRAEIASLAVRQAWKEGLTGQAGAARAQELRANPTEEMLSKAAEKAKLVTFQTQLGEKGRAVQQMTKKIGPVAQMIAPFQVTPTNILKRAIEYTPAAPALREFRDAYKAGGHARELALSRIAIGSAIGALVVYEGTQGRITGFGPREPARRKAWLEDHQPYSVRVGDSWYSYARLEPVASVVGIAADMAEIANDHDDLTNAQQAQAVTLSIATNLTSKTYMRGLSDLISAMQDPKREGAQWVTGMVGTAIPTGVSQVARAIDPVQRDTAGVLDTLQSRVPGLSSSLPAKRSAVTGEEITRGGSLGPDFISPIYTKTDKGDPVAAEMVRLRIGVSQPERSVDKEPMTPQQYERFVGESSKKAHSAVARVMQNPNWGKIPDEDRVKVIRDVYEAAHKQARDELRVQRAGGR